MSEQWLTITDRAGTTVVRLAGEIDLSNATDIGHEIMLACGRAPAVLVDLTAVSFLDSAGVRLLDVLVGDLEMTGTPIRLVVAERGAVRMTLQLCAFRDELLATDLDRAAAELGS